MRAFFASFPVAPVQDVLLQGEKKLFPRSVVTGATGLAHRPLPSVAVEFLLELLRTELATAVGMQDTSADGSGPAGHGLFQFRG